MMPSTGAARMGRCMSAEKQEFVCWHDQESEEDGSTFEAYDAKEAAEDYARECWSDEAYEYLEVSVRRKGSDDTVRTFCTEVEYEPDFFTYEI